MGNLSQPNFGNFISYIIKQTFSLPLRALYFLASVLFTHFSYIPIGHQALWRFSQKIKEKNEEKPAPLAIAAICCVVLTLVRVFFTAIFFITSVICIVIVESRVERCDGYITLSQLAVDSLNTTSTFVETVVSSFLIFLIYRWKEFNFKFLKALPRQGDFWMWTTLWVARIFTNVLIDIIPGINLNYPVSSSWDFIWALSSLQQQF